VFTLADTTVDEVMTPRLDMRGVDLSESMEEVVDAFRQTEHARLPVLDGSPDNVAGVLFAKDLVPIALALAEPGARWQAVVRPASFVPETKTLDSQLEDILEEIVGEIRDEHDEEAPAAIRRDGARFWVDGRVSLDDLSEALGATFVHSEVSTVGGLVYSVLGRVPRQGDELTLDGFRVVVERVDQRRVTQVSFQKP
jgi:CBS domain containing-hemolysin-like protein